MFAQPKDSGISIAVELEMRIPDPEKAIALEVIYGNRRTDDDNPESSEQDIK